MLKLANYDIVFREVPEHVTLALNISNCPNRCEGCHTPYLRDNIGVELTQELLGSIIESKSGITCVCFMGDGGKHLDLEVLLSYIKGEFPNLKTAVYLGEDKLPFTFDISNLDYIKLGHYDSKRGPLTSETTNQRMYEYDVNYPETTIGKGWRDITYKFWNK